MRRLSRFLGRFLLAVVLVAALGAAAAVWNVSTELRRVAVSGADQPFTVPPGASLRSALNQLAAQHILRYPRLIEAVVRWHYGTRAGVKSGNYLLPSGSTSRQIIEQLRQGRVLLEQITLIEGWNLTQFRQALDTHAAVTHTWRSLSSAAIMEQLGHAGLPAEGRFFPDTYRFAAGTPDSAVYRMAFERMTQELAAAWAQRADDGVLDNPDQLLIFASVVEKETGREDERAKVAGVFANRLRIGMKLQSDPTVIYGLGTSYDGDIRSRDLVTDTPYNTYTREGLPPTPIAMPGAASLRAAAHPDASKALFFVATGNGDGSHHFSATLDEHNAAVARFLRRTRARPRAQP